MAMSKIPGYTDYVVQEAAAFKAAHRRPVEDFITVLKLYVDDNVTTPCLVRANQLAWDLEEIANNTDSLEAYPDDWILRSFNVCDLIDLLDSDLRKAGIKCWVPAQDMYLLPELAKNKSVFFYTDDRFRDWHGYCKRHPQV